MVWVLKRKAKEKQQKSQRRFQSKYTILFVPNRPLCPTCDAPQYIKKEDGVENPPNKTIDVGVKLISDNPGPV
ncbi:MAG: hypothetical protein ACTSUE_17055, partial [Promethearchaeota archaeon]